MKNDRSADRGDALQEFLWRAWIVQEFARLSQFPWRSLCRAALRERDPRLLPRKIACAEAAVDRRLQHMNAGPRNRASATLEEQALADARDSLNTLKQRHLGQTSS